MLREALSIKADLTMVHSEAGLWVGKQLRQRGFRVGVDFEDWFSEDLPMADRKGRPLRLLKALERTLLREANLTLTTTQVMAKAMARDAGCGRIPVAIPNCFPMVEIAKGTYGGDERDRLAVSFYWFSQTIGPGRGLESLALAVQQLRGQWELHLRGNLRGYDRWFEAHFPPAILRQVHVHPCVSNADLPGHSACHDVGLALEVPHCPSRDLTATNKIFEYLRCGLAVIATSTQGQQEVMDRCPSAGWMVPPDDGDALSKAMQRCLDLPSALMEAKQASLTAAETVWSWRHCQHLIASALKKNSSRNSML
jgi:glycosyltransferase involved in cell wall biosynthesis